MRIVGKVKMLTTDMDRWIAGVTAIDLTQALGVQNFRTGGVFRGPQQLFGQMDAERLAQRQKWIHEHSS